MSETNTSDTLGTSGTVGTSGTSGTLTKAEQKAHINAHMRRFAYCNKLRMSPLKTDQRMCRLYEATGCHTPKELASFFGVSTSTIAKVKKSGVIPAEWLILVLQVRNVHPDWVVMNKGPMYLECPSEEEYESTQAFLDRKHDQMALDRMTSFTLAQELLRRIALGIH